MRKLAGVLLVMVLGAVLGCFIVIAQAQTTTPSVPVAVGETATVLLQKQYVNVVAVRQTTGTYMAHPTFKTGVKGLRVYRNGLRMASGIDYDFSATTGVITPKIAANWNATDLVLLDFYR